VGAVEIEKHEIEPGLDFSWQSHDEENFSESDLSGVRFVGAYLARADFSGSDLTKARFVGAYLRGAVLTGANLSGADFTRAVLNSAHLGFTIFSGTNFEQAKANRDTIWPKGFDPIAAGVVVKP
jgi:uncharacterized protein YjbI with pentapeptide repeats|tara:strand:+ start:211 stop:582 length:372 start_codon:yes stop_codon:yes gene_type:complete